jgi:hypothetical protein
MRSFCFCGLSFIEPCVLLATPGFFGPSTLRPTMPSADSRCTVRMDRSILRHDSVTCRGSPEVSSTAFDAQPPDLPPVWVEAGFAVAVQLAPHCRPRHPVLVHRLVPLIHASFRLRLRTTPSRFSSPSPPPGWAGDFHPQTVEQVRHTILTARLAARRFVSIDPEALTPPTDSAPSPSK